MEMLLLQDLASGAQLVPVKAVAVLRMEIGRQHFKHEFAVADINCSAILGSDFQGMYGSMLCYSTMQFHPCGDKSIAVALFEATASDISVEGVLPQQQLEHATEQKGVRRIESEQECAISYCISNVRLIS
jgi:hypothetical protein